MISGLLEGLLNLKRMGATQLIVDIVNGSIYRIERSDADKFIADQ
jgi:hypothetical protein